MSLPWIQPAEDIADAAISLFDLLEERRTPKWLRKRAAYWQGRAATNRGRGWLRCARRQEGRASGLNTEAKRKEESGYWDD